MLTQVNWAVRRVFAWPSLFLGMLLVEAGGVLITFAAWAIDFDVETGEPR